MALIEFKDLPDTSTPLTADSLNNNFDELNDDIEELNITLNKMKTITLNNTWYICHKLSGGGVSTVIPIYNPNNTTPTISIQSAGVFINGSWYNVTLNTTNFNKTYVFLSFDSGSLSITEGSSYLIRIRGTITIPQN